MKKLPLLVLLLSFLACKKEQKPPVVASNSETRLLNDSAYYVGMPIALKVDLDNDSTADIAFYRLWNQGHNWGTDSMGVKVLNAEVAVGVLSKDFYQAVDTIYCQSGTTPYTRYSSMMVDTPADATFPTTFAVCDTLHQVPPVFGSKGVSIMAFDFRWSDIPPAGTCPFTSQRFFVGNKPSTDQYFYFNLNSENYAVLVKDKIPYLYVKSVTKL